MILKKLDCLFRLLIGRQISLANSVFIVSEARYLLIIVFGLITNIIYRSNVCLVGLVCSVLVALV
jgi:hypothetical protein